MDLTYSPSKGWKETTYKEKHGERELRALMRRAQERGFRIRAILIEPLPLEEDLLDHLTPICPW